MIDEDCEVCNVEIKRDDSYMLRVALRAAIDYVSELDRVGAIDATKAKLSASLFPPSMVVPRWREVLEHSK